MEIAASGVRVLGQNCPMVQPDSDQLMGLGGHVQHGRRNLGRDPFKVCCSSFGVVPGHLLYRGSRWLEKELDLVCDINEERQNRAEGAGGSLWLHGIQ